MMLMLCDGTWKDISSGNLRKIAVTRVQQDSDLARTAMPNSESWTR